jgi:hypothetical protein
MCSLVPSKYDNTDDYQMLSENHIYEQGYVIHQMIYKVLEDGSHIKRTLKYSQPGLSKDQLEAIQARSELPKFGNWLNDPNYENPTTIADNTFIEYNPEILKSRKSRKHIETMLSDPFNVDKIKVKTEDENELNKIVNGVYNNIKNKYDSSTLNYNLKYITSDYLNTPKWCESKKKVLIKPKPIKNKGTGVGAFIPRFARNRNNGDSQTEIIDLNTNSNDSGKFIPRYKRDQDDDKDKSKSVRLYGFPDEADYNDIKQWIYPFRVGRHKLTVPRDRVTGLPRGYCFLNFNFDDDVQDCIDKLDKQKYDYTIIKAEVSKK